MGKRTAESTGGLWKRVLRSVINILILFAIFFPLAVFFGERWLIFPGTSLVYRTPAAMNWEFEDVVLEVGEEKTHGWYIPLEKESRGCVLFSHGNAGNIADRLESCELFRNLGFDVFVYDYGGYGQSTGKPSEKRCYADIRAAWHYLSFERAIPDSRIVLFGRSLGGGPTAQLATEVKPGAIILESTFASIAQVAKRTFPILPMKLLLRTKFESIKKVSSFSAPLLVAHSPEDDVIPYENGKLLFEAAKEPKTFFEMRGSHNEGFWMMEDEYRGQLDAFLKNAMPVPQQVNLMILRMETSFSGARTM